MSGLKGLISKAGLYNFGDDAADGAPPSAPPSEGGSPFDFSAADPTPTAAAPKPVASTPLDWPLEQVYAAAKIEQGKNSADTPLLLRDSLKARSKTPLTDDQILMMVRAMDENDESWNETDALADAKKRVAALTRFLTFIDRDVAARVDSTNQECVRASANADALMAQLDGQIAALQAQREQAIAEKGGAKASADAAAQTVKAQGEAKKASIQSTIDRYKELLALFGA